jgi:hypothetical protein
MAATAAMAAATAADMAAGTAAGTAAATAADAGTAAATAAVTAAATAAAGEAASEFGGADAADAADAALVVIGAGETACGSGAITNPRMVRLDWGMRCSCSAAHVVASRETLACELNGVLFAT